EAWPQIEETLRIDPNHVEARWQRGLFRLMHGDFERGWPDFEVRWALPNKPPRVFERPRWDGTPVPGKTILVFAEQALGDTIEFIRYLPMVKERAARVIFECQRPLVGALRGIAGADELFAQGDALPSHDVQVPLLSLPGIFDTTVTTIPPPIPFPPSASACL